ncbi:MAG: hypothetical protein A3F84_03675 [Candidatus Handelsmanbacteria bacterium RIFCSPLOWO2_12_FULL_64_10]|uniref:Uncharacterized protein n=1 Tax=Handelsmanbacteria sp. (strain RIFCSPLOWO2_12_FULL_64_10) TaxID=1817868 RepID=A0A1F6CXG7_HANXR|nr:MAG: hypothetical protein A3F84_03675 [Candidatus Handelsmanbacteria bacterium RIFCSPLOWO2_12_FULL_64_10]
MSDVTQTTGVPGMEEKTSAAQQAKNEAAVRLLKEWLKDESGYDEETWPKLKETIEANRLSYRRRSHD